MIKKSFTRSIKKTTAKTVLEILEWIENNEHHYAACVEPKGTRPVKWGNGETTEMPDYQFFLLKGYGSQIRIPMKLHEQTDGMVRPSPEKFDTRMYRCNRKGLLYITREHKRLNGGAKLGDFVTTGENTYDETGEKILTRQGVLAGHCEFTLNGEDIQVNVIRGFIDTYYVPRGDKLVTVKDKDCYNDAATMGLLSQVRKDIKKELSK